MSGESEKKTNSVKSDLEEEYFEGILEYSIDYELINQSISKDLLKKYLGTRITRSYSEGNWREDYYNDEGTWVRTSILNQTKKKYYYEMIGNDTVFYSMINKTNYTTSIEQLSDTIIDNHECWTIKSLSIRNDIQPDTTLVVYYISKSIKVNPSWYINYVDGGYNRIYEIAPGIEYETKYTNINFTQIRKLVSKSIEKVNDSEFEIDSTKIIKKTSLQ